MSMEIKAPMPGKIAALPIGVGSQVQEEDEVIIMDAMKMEIPIYIICHNNGFMVETTVSILIQKFKNPIVIIDNQSDTLSTQLILKKIEEQKIPNVKIDRRQDNTGPWVVSNHPDYEEVRKNFFILTDPDLEIDFLPEDTIDVL